MSQGMERSVNIIPYAKIKKEKVVVIDEDVVQCRLCSKGFASVVALRNHVKMEHIEAFASGKPEKWTKYVDRSDQPRNIHKEDEIKMIQEKTEEIISSMEPTSIMSLASNDVSYIIIKADPMPPHKRARAERNKDLSPGSMPKKEREPKLITGPFECLQPSTLVADGACHQIFFSCCEYSIHVRDEHTRRRKGVKCQVCEKSLMPNAEHPYFCQVCGEGFDTNKALSDHTSTAHVKLKPFECTVCFKRFTQQGGVLQHMRMHTGDRPFPCTFCSKAFTQKSGLDQHLRIHTKVKPYRCVVCSKTFCQSVHLKQHMRTHTNVAPFVCGICDKRFKQSSHLNYHLKNHNPASMTEEQRTKYEELIGLINKEVVEIEVDQTQCVMEPACELGGDNNEEVYSVSGVGGTWNITISGINEHILGS